MRLSRWGQSNIETDGALRSEAKALSECVDVLDHGQNAEIIVIHSKIRFGLTELKNARDLRLLITTTSGTDHIDLAVLRDHGVQVARLPLVRRDAVVETTLGMVLWGLHRWGDLDKAARKGEWARGSLPALAPRLLIECRVGLVGLGVIGTEVARILALLGVEVWGCDPAGVPAGVRSASLPEMLTQCAALSLHCDLNPTTHGLISAEELAICDPELVLVNTARGGLLDTAAAIQNLRSGRLGALCLDVFAQEPFADMGAVGTLPRLWLHPHSAGYHRNLPRAVRQGLLDTVRAFRAGQPVPHPVT